MNTLNTTPVTEWAPFTLKPGITEAQLLEASRELQKGFLEQMGGFLHRELLKKSDREFVDLIRWKSRHDVEAAMPKAMDHPSCKKYFDLMLPSDGSNAENGMVIASLLREYR